MMRSLSLTYLTPPAVADLRKLAKDPTKVTSATSVEDFVPPGDGSDDFWGGDDDDDDDEEDAKKVDWALCSPPCFSMNELHSADAPSI